MTSISRCDSSSSSHITSILSSTSSSSSQSQPYFSLEFFPPKTSQGLSNLYSRISRVNSELRPDWTHVTWGAGGTTYDRSLELAARIQTGKLDPSRPLTREDGDGETEGRRQVREKADSRRRNDVCLHLTCTNVEKGSLDKILEDAKALGIRNILALRGDPPRGEEYWIASDSSFQHATDLVRYIRQKYGGWFCIGVAAYPEGHPDSSASVPLPSNSAASPALDSASSSTSQPQGSRQDMIHLLEKQNSGADFIVTQLFYDVDGFIQWYKNCREAGITLPIIPGIMPIQNYQSFRRMTNLCKARVPSEVLEALEPIRFDDAAVKAYGVSNSISMIRRLQKETDIKGFHLCTLNLEKSIRLVLEGLGWVGRGLTRELRSLEKRGEDQHPKGNKLLKDAPGNATPKDLKVTTSEALHQVLAKSHLSDRSQTLTSTSTPIINGDKSISSLDSAITQLSSPESPTSTWFSNTPETDRAWDEFPNGRWGDSRSPAYGEMDGYGASLKMTSNEALRTWGYPVTISDISAIFVSYLLGKAQTIPWCDAPIMDESAAIRNELLWLNCSSDDPAQQTAAASATTTTSSDSNCSPCKGLGGGKSWWTVGSQPAVDGCNSSDPTYGFGPPDGYVFQKAFVEFFVSEQDLKELREKVEEEGEGKISWLAGNKKGDFLTNMSPGDVNAVTWGIFPGKEIVQSTIIEEESFKAWREEAFAIWDEWSLLYPVRSETYKLLKSISDSRWLVTVVHHDYKDESALWKFLGCGDVKR